MRPQEQIRALSLLAALIGVLAFPGRGDAGALRGTAPGGEVTGTPQLPSAVGVWHGPDAPRRIEGDGLFEYMNGAGELYLAYRFERLEVYEYATEGGEPGILVELYRMEHPDDAYGLLSEDWSGEALALGELTTESRRALYGAGLLRLACGSLYARVLTDETLASRDAVLELGRALAVGCGGGTPPRIVSELPPRLGPGEAPLELRRDRVRFLRSYLVLNSAYYLASDDVLGLEHTDDAVYTEYRPAGGDHTTRVIAVRIRYSTPERAAVGLARFQGQYLGLDVTTDAPGDRGTSSIEDGWVGYERRGHDLTLVFEAPDVAIAGRLTDDLAASTAGR